MAWVIRGDKRYYYRSIKVARKVEKEYVGIGPMAEEAAAEDERNRQERQSRLALRRQEQERYLSIIAPLNDLCATTDLILKATLVGAGYHQHARGAWRLKNVSDTEKSTFGKDLPQRTQTTP